MVITAGRFLKIKGILKAEINDSLASALAQLRSSHDAVFVLEKDRLLGIINPYHVLYRSRFPARTKVKNCLFHPPKIKISTPLTKVAKLMVDSKVYYLPVVDDKGKMLGIVSYRRLLEWLKSKKDLSSFSKLLRPKKLVTIEENLTIGQARTLMKPGGTSRLMVINKVNKLIGILTRFDLREALAEPQMSQKFLSRVGNKLKVSRQPIKPYVKKEVVTIKRSTPLKQVLRLMLNKEIGSVAIVNDQHQPIGIISTKDWLTSLAEFEDSQISRLIVSLPNEFGDQAELTRLVQNKLNQLEKKIKIIKFTVQVKLEFNRKGKVSRYQVLVTAKPAGKLAVASQVKGYDWRKVVREALSKVEVQIK